MGARIAEKSGMFVYGLVTSSGAVTVTITAARMTNAGVAGIGARGGWAGSKRKQSPKF